MARLTDQELIDLKARAFRCQIAGMHLAHAETHLVDLITEVLELRKMTPKPELVVKKLIAQEAPKPALNDEAPVVESVPLAVETPEPVAKLEEEPPAKETVPPPSGKSKRRK